MQTTVTDLKAAIAMAAIQANNNSMSHLLCRSSSSCVHQQRLKQWPAATCNEAQIYKGNLLQQFQCTIMVLIVIQATFTAMVPAMQQQDFSKAATKTTDADIQLSRRHIGI